MIKRGVFCEAVLCFALLAAMVPHLKAQNQVLGEVAFDAKTKIDKTSGVWVDGQYLGYVDELKDKRKVLLLPGKHEISVRQSGYSDLDQDVLVEPGKKDRCTCFHAEGSPGLSICGHFTDQIKSHAG